MSDLPKIVIKPGDTSADIARKVVAGFERRMPDLAATLANRLERTRGVYPGDTIELTYRAIVDGAETSVRVIPREEHRPRRWWSWLMP